MEVGQNIRDRYVDQSSKCDQRFVLNALEVLSQTDINYKTSKNQRLLVELALLKISALSEKLLQKKNFSTQQVRSENASSDEISEKNLPKPEPVSEKATKVQEYNPPISEENNQDPIESKSKPSVAEEINESDNRPSVKFHGQEINTETPNPETIKISDETPSAEHSEPQHTDKKEIDPKRKSRLGGSKLGSLKTKGVPSLSGMKTVSNSDPGSNEINSDELSSDSGLLENKPRNEFNQAQLWEVWDAYAEQIRALDKQSYYATLTKHRPILKEKYKLELLVDNHVQKADLDADKANLLEFIREKLQNWGISLEGIIDEEEKDDGDSLYEPHKKFQAMVEKNPNLSRLRDIFDLEIDYDT